MNFLLSDYNIFILLIAVVSGLMLLWPTLSKGRSSSVSVTEAVTLANQRNAVFLDVRPHEQFKGGTIAQARNVPVADIDAKMSSLSKDKPVIVFCEHGRQSQAVTSKLRKAGYEAVNLEGGLTKWIDAGMPVGSKH